MLYEFIEPFGLISSNSHQSLLFLRMPSFAGPDARRVEPRFFGCARLSAGLIWAYLLMVFVVSCVNIYKTRHSPRTETQVFPVSEKFGRMPYIVIIHPYDVIQYAGFEEFFGGGTVYHNFEILGAEQHPLSRTDHTLVINGTNLKPYFDVREVHGFETMSYPNASGMETRTPPYLQVGLLNPMTESLNMPTSICTAPHDLSSENRSALEHPDGDWTFMTCRDLQLKCPDLNSGVYQYMNLKKSIIPRPGIFWGWWWDDDHTMEDFELTVEKSQTSTDLNDRGLTWIVITIHQGTVTVTKPQSVLGQVGQLLSSTGGLLGLLTAIFYVIFVPIPNLDRPKQVDLTLFTARVFPRKQTALGAHEGSLQEGLLTSVSSPVLQTEASLV